MSAVLNPSSTWDRPVSNAELEVAYRRPSDEEVAEEIGKASADFDAGELGDVCAIAFEQIVDLIAAKDAKALGEYVMFLRRQRIADIASRAIYGKTGLIFAAEVKV